MILKQLFCRHIFKSESLEKTRKVFDFGVGIWQYYIEHQVCVKCSKKRIVEQRYLVW